MLAFLFAGAITIYTEAITTYTVAITTYTVAITTYTVAITTYTVAITTYTVAITTFTEAITTYTVAITTYTMAITTYTVAIITFKVVISMYTYWSDLILLYGFAQFIFIIGTRIAFFTNIFWFFYFSESNSLFIQFTMYFGHNLMFKFLISTTTIYTFFCFAIAN